MPKKSLDINVLEAAQQRISWIMDNCPRVYVSFSGGKDSSVLLHLTIEEAKQRKRKIGVLFIDLEAQYKLTIDYIREVLSLYRDHIEVYWIALPMNLRNAVSVFEPQWICWDAKKKLDWVRQPPEEAITDINYFPFFRVGMEFEEFVVDFGRWYSKDGLTACLVGIRADESLNRFRTIAREKSRLQKLPWTTYIGGTVFNAYPIYDWRTRDIWIYNGRFERPYNRLYDLMHRAGLSIHQQRICQPYGDDQRKGLYLYHVIEPETWCRVVARVNGANQGALYAQESGNILGRLKITRPPGHTWESFAWLIIESLPPATQEHYKNKIAVFLRWWGDRGYPIIPDEADPKQEAARKIPSWRRICKSLLRNDYWCKGLSFSQHKSEAYKKYLKLMRRRRSEWGLGF